MNKFPAVLLPCVAALSLPQATSAADVILTPVTTEISCDRTSGKPVPSSATTTWKATFTAPAKASCADGSERNWQPGESMIFTVNGASSENGLMEAYMGGCSGLPEDAEIRHIDEAKVVYTASCAGM